MSEDGEICQLCKKPKLVTGLWLHRECYAKLRKFLNEKYGNGILKLYEGGRQKYLKEYLAQDKEKVSFT